VISVVNLVIRHIVVTLLAYLCGALPVGYTLVYWFKGIDIRKQGSGRTGGTNVLRTAGTLPAILTVLADAGKGALAILIARLLGGTPAAVALAGVAVILGHNHSIFLGWEGGAGTMTMIGVALAISPAVGAAVIVMGIAILAISRYASLASVTIALVLPVLYGAGAIWGGLPAIYVAYAVVSGLISIFELLPNIGRLLAGTERKIGVLFPQPRAPQRQ
jgi:acyl phosphate:glycerol-3-phosphate acyltransferase